MDFDIVLAEPWESAVLLLAALAFALPTALNRERNSRIMGLRTFPIVSMAACGYILIGQSFIGPDSPDAMARIMQGLLTGVGFVGGGAILKSNDHVKGTASAASIWIMGAIGAAVAFELWGLAIFLSGFNFVVVWLMGSVKHKVPTHPKDP